MEDNFHLLLDLDVAARQPDLLRKVGRRAQRRKQKNCLEK